MAKTPKVPEIPAETILGAPFAPTVTGKELKETLLELGAHLETSNASVPKEHPEQIGSWADDRLTKSFEILSKILPDGAEAHSTSSLAEALLETDSVEALHENVTKEKEKDTVYGYIAAWTESKNKALGKWCEAISAACENLGVKALFKTLAKAIPATTAALVLVLGSTAEAKDKNKGNDHDHGSYGGNGGNSHYSGNNYGGNNGNGYNRVVRSGTTTFVFPTYEPQRDCRPEYRPRPVVPVCRPNFGAYQAQCRPVPSLLDVLAVIFQPRVVIQERVVVREVER